MIDNVINLLVTVLGNYQKFSNNEYYFVCPLCTKKDGKKKLAVKINPNDVSEIQWHCWRDETHKGKSIRNLFKRINAIPALEKYDEYVGKKHLSYDINSLDTKLLSMNKNQVTTHHNIFLPKEYERLHDSESSFYSNMAWSYLMERGLTYYDVVKYNIGYCSSGQYAGYIIIPSYDANGILNYFVGRTFQNSFMKYKNPSAEKSKIIFNEIHINWKMPVVICEGVFDAIAIKRNAIPILGNTISNTLKQKLINHGSDVYVALDSDMFNQSVRVIEDFIKNALNVYYVELDKKDPAEVGFAEMNNKIHYSKKMTMQEFLKLKLGVKPIKRNF